MIPQGGSITNQPVREVMQPSYTWGLDLRRKRITGHVDELDAVKQAVFKILQTQRFRHVIYSPNYGHELHRLIGQDPLLVQSEIRRFLEEALMQDDRIEGINNLNMEINGDSILVKFTVLTIYGSFEERWEGLASV